MKYIKEFSNHAAYTAYTASAEFVTPNVSYCNEENEVHYNPYVPPTPPTPSFKYKFTLNDSSVVTGECDATSAVTQAEISAYTATTVSAEIGDCATSIGEYAFYFNFNGLTSVTISDNVTNIGEKAFGELYNLKTVTIGTGVTSIGSQAFFRLSNLTGLTINATTPPTIGITPFAAASYPIYVPSESVNAYKTNESWSYLADRIQAIP